MKKLISNFLQGAAIAALLTSGVFAQTIGGSPAGVSSLSCNSGITCTGGSAGQSASAGLSTISNHKILGNTSGGTLAPIETSVTEWFNDALCSTQGSLVTKTGAGWVCLAPGTSGQFLKTLGGGANAAWATVSGGSGGGGFFNYSDNGVTVTANTYFIPIGGGGVPTTTEANVSVPAPAATSVSNLQVSVSVAPGAGNSYTITLRDGGADQAVTCVISGASATTCQDITHSFNVAAADLIDWKFVSAGTIVTTPTVNITAANGTSNVGTTSVTGTSPITVTNTTTTPVVACATCTTNAAALTSNQLVTGGGSQAAQTLGSLGTTTTVLHGNAAGAPSFAATSLTADVSGTLPVGNGGTGQTAPTNHGIILGQGASATVTTAALTNGQVLIGQTGADPAPTTVSQDCILSAAGLLTCTKTNNVAFATSATTDTTNASNITTGNLPAAQLPTGSGPLYYTQVSLSSAQLKAINGTPITIVAAPGAGSGIIVHRTVLSYTYGTATYTGGTAFGTYYNSTGTATSGSIGNAITAVASTVGSVAAVAINNLATASLMNQPVTAFATSNFVTGDGTAKIGVYYSIWTP